MMKKSKKALALLLALVSIFSVTSVFAAAAPAGQAAFVNDCTDGSCDYAPSIVVHGIAQSIVRVKNDDGSYLKTASGKDVTTFPPAVDTNSLIGKVLGPALGTLLFQRDIQLSRVVGEAVTDVFKYCKNDLQGNPVYNVEVEKYPTNLANLPQDLKANVYKNMPLNEYAAIAGESHTYYFAYNSFGNVLDIADELAEYIKMVMEETGHDKVNIVPISLGGAIMTAFMDTHKEMYDHINKVVFIVPAADGSMIVSDIFKGEFNYADEMLYNQMLPSLVEGYQGYLLNLLIRILPRDVLVKVLSSTLDKLIDLLKTCTNMWALVPRGEYEALAEKLLSGSEYDYLRARTARYQQAQMNREANINAMRAQGIEVFDIVDYDFPMYNVVTSWNKYNSDGIVHVDSSSFNAYSVPLGQTLPADYEQQNTFCTDPTHNHISPSRTVDASAGLLCETTWYMHAQDHEGTGRNDIVMSLAFTILTDDNIKDVHSDPRYPQFMDGRESRHLKYTLVPQAKEVLETQSLSPEKEAKLRAALNDATELLGRGSDSYERYLAVEANLENVLVELGVRGEPQKESLMDKLLYSFFKGLSDKVYKATGAAGYKDMFANRK